MPWRQRWGAPYLTPREEDVLALLAEGCTSHEVAERLDMSHKVVTTHKQRVFAKLEVQNQAHAVATAIRLGLLPDVAPGWELVVDRISEGVLTLTPRDRDILDSIDRGESVKQTAYALGISMKTVENLQAALYRKLGVRNRVQAVAMAHAIGYFNGVLDGEQGSTAPDGAGPSDTPSEELGEAAAQHSVFNWVRGRRRRTAS
jgi:DNA-binding CsgD family transcriptional regulator